MQSCRGVPVVKGVIYDLDNTIASTFLVKLFVGFLLLFRHPLTILGFLSEGPRGIMDATMTELIERHAPPRKREEIVDRYEKLLARVARLARVVDPHEITPQGMKIAIFSNSSKRTIETILSSHGIDTSDILIVSGEEVENKKPHPDGIKKILEEWGLRPGEVVMVGDSPMDVRAGKMAGVVTIAVENMLYSLYSIMRENPDYIVSRIGDVKPLLEHIDTLEKENSKKNLSRH